MRFHIPKEERKEEHHDVHESAYYTAPGVKYSRLVIDFSNECWWLENFCKEVGPAPGGAPLSAMDLAAIRVIIEHNRLNVPSIRHKLAELKRLRASKGMLEDPQPLPAKAYTTWPGGTVTIAETDVHLWIAAEDSALCYVDVERVYSGTSGPVTESPHFVAPELYKILRERPIERLRQWCLALPVVHITDGFHVKAPDGTRVTFKQRARDYENIRVLIDGRSVDTATWVNALSYDGKTFDFMNTTTKKETDNMNADQLHNKNTAEGTSGAPAPESAVSSAWTSFKEKHGDKITGMARRAACRSFVDLVTGNVAKLIAGKDADDAARNRIAAGLKTPIGRALVGFLISVFVRNTLIRFTKEESDFLKTVTDELEEEAGSIVIGELFSALLGPLQSVLNIVATKVAESTAQMPPELPEGIQGATQDERIHIGDKAPALHQSSLERVYVQKTCQGAGACYVPVLAGGTRPLFDMSNLQVPSGARRLAEPLVRVQLPAYFPREVSTRVYIVHAQSPVEDSLLDYLLHPRWEVRGTTTSLLPTADEWNG